MNDRKVPFPNFCLRNEASWSQVRFDGLGCRKYLRKEGKAPVSAV